MAQQMTQKNTVGKTRTLREERKRAFETERRGLLPLFAAVFGAILLCSLITLILLCSEKIAISYVRNTSLTENNGREFILSARSLLRALFGGSYLNVPNADLDATYGARVDLFGHFSPALCAPTAVFTFLAVLFTALTLASAAGGLVLSLVKRDYIFISFTAALALLSVLFLFLAYGLTASMSGDVFLGYQCNPEVCSIRTDWVFPLLLSVLALGGAVFGTVRFLLLERKRKIRK